MCMLYRDFINNRLLTYGGDLSIGAFGILNRIQMLFVMIVMGITMGMQPISGYNYGARHYDRVKQTLRLGIIAGCTITTVGFLISELFPSIFVGMFTTNHELTEQATLALRIGVMAFPIIGAQIVITQFSNQSVKSASLFCFLFPDNSSFCCPDWLYFRRISVWKESGSVCRYRIH